MSETYRPARHRYPPKEDALRAVQRARVEFKTPTNRERTEFQATCVTDGRAIKSVITRRDYEIYDHFTLKHAAAAATLET